MEKENLDNGASQATFSEKIYRYLKDCIIKNIIKPNEKINEKEVAALFNSSKTPVREAIMKLSAEGFFENAANKYAVVMPCSYKKFQELSDVMVLLEGYLFKLALKNLHEETIRTIEDMTKQMQGLCSPKTTNEYFDFNVQIHDLILAAAENTTCLSLLKLVRDNYMRHMMFILESNQSLLDSHLKKSMKNHLKLNRALKNRNATQLIRIIKEHYSQYM
jgi:DNA-binding GntR family transcriptional regulator